MAVEVCLVEPTLWRSSIGRAGMCVPLLILGCGVPNGDELTSKVDYYGQDDRFAITYVTPPWGLAVTELGELQLEISAEVFGIALDGSPATHQLSLGVVDPSGDLAVLLDDEVPGPDGFGTDGFGTDGFGTDGFETDGFGTDGFGTDGFETDGGISEEVAHLLEVDLSNPREVAFAELDYLVAAHGAQVDTGIQYYDTVAGLHGVEYQVVLAPGLFVRTFYFPVYEGTLRVAFVSMFDLRTSDIELMVDTLRTDVEGPLR